MDSGDNWSSFIRRCSGVNVLASSERRHSACGSNRYCTDIYLSSVASYRLCCKYINIVRSLYV